MNAGNMGPRREEKLMTDGIGLELVKSGRRLTGRARLRGHLSIQLLRFRFAGHPGDDYSQRYVTNLLRA